MFETLTARLGVTAAILICGYAIWRGGLAEKASGAVVGVGWILTGILVTRRNIAGPDWSTFTIDVVGMLLIGWASFVSRRPWTLFVTACQLIAVTAHLATVIDLRVSVYIYRRGLALWSYAMLAAILWGTIEVEIDRRRFPNGRPALR